MTKPVRLPILSARLEAVAGMVTSCHRVFDIGTDHAFLPIELVIRGICREAIASDIRQGPIDVAQKNIARAGLGDLIATCVTFGMKGHRIDPDDAIVMAGLGGLEMIDILSDLTKPAGQVILQPQKSAMELRIWLDANGYRIAAEDLVLDRSRIYVIIRAVPQEMTCDSTSHTPLTLTEAVLGPCLLQHRHPLFNNYLLQAARHLKVARQRMPELSDVLDTLHALLDSHDGSLDIKEAHDESC